MAITQGSTAACAALAVPRSSFYRAQATPRASASAPPEPAPRPAPPRALSPAEKAQVRDVLNSERFQDQAPREIYATLLDEERYLCSVSTMYRILAEHAEVRERRNQRRHPTYQKPELLAAGPNQGWSWDITKLRGPSKGVYYSLYVMRDLYSRYVVGWLLVEVESAGLAEQLIAETCAKQGVQRAQLTIHADNGSAMMATSVANLLADLGVTKSRSRPHVANDNPYSEAQCTTLKYRPDYPDRFASVADARRWARRFFAWYNDEHCHTGLGRLTPTVVHTGQAETVRQKRQAVLDEAYRAHPERFVRGQPQPAELPAAVWINPPPSPTESSTPDVAQRASAAGLHYTNPCRTEDRATLRSDPSAAPADGVAGQGGRQANPAHTQTLKGATLSSKR